MIEIGIGLFVLAVSYMIFCLYQYYKYGDPTDGRNHQYPYTFERHVAGFFLYAISLISLVFGLIVAAYCIGTALLAVIEFLL